jgi:hypothetical protein
LGVPRPRLGLDVVNRVPACWRFLASLGKSTPISIALAAAVSVIAAGCGAGTQLGDASQAAAPQDATKRVAVCDPAFAYRNLAHLRRNATSVVVFMPTGATSVRQLAGIAFTTSIVAVRERVAGRHVGPLLSLRQTGAAGAPGCETLVSRNKVYLAYIAPFQWRRGGPAVRGQYVAVGLFEHPGSTMPRRSEAAFASLNPQQPSLPAKISIAQASQS